MTTEEKLQHFLVTCMEDARGRSQQMLDDYQATLEAAFAKHQQETRQQAKERLELETEQIGRDNNKRLSLEHINLKRRMGQLQEELKERLFQELHDKLAGFRDTPEYLRLLEKQIAAAVSFADGEGLTVWIDPADRDKVKLLARPSGDLQIKISEQPFGGGTQAIIPSRHVMIDNSFKSKLSEAKEAFHFEVDADAGRAASDLTLGLGSQGPLGTQDALSSQDTLSSWDSQTKIGGAHHG